MIITGIRETWKRCGKGTEMCLFYYEKNFFYVLFVKKVTMRKCVNVYKTIYFLKRVQYS